MSRIDPYNNAPPPRPGGGGCGGGSCGNKPASQQYTGPPISQQLMAPPPVQRVPTYTSRPMAPSRPDLQTENQLLIADLQLAIRYIQQLGGTWPPPGH